MGDRAGKAVGIGFRTVYGGLESVYPRLLAKSLDRRTLEGMDQDEVKKLLELPVAERLALARRLEASVQQDGELRYEPIGEPQVALARECLEALVEVGGREESCEVIEA